MRRKPAGRQINDYSVGESRAAAAELARMSAELRAVLSGFRY
jgi:hypothetical protein